MPERQCPPFFSSALGRGLFIPPDSFSKISALISGRAPATEELGFPPWYSFSSPLGQLRKFDA